MVDVAPIQLRANLEVQTGKSLYCARSSFPKEMTELLLSLCWRMLFPIFPDIVGVTGSQLGRTVLLPSWPLVTGRHLAHSSALTVLVSGLTGLITKI